MKKYLFPLAALAILLVITTGIFVARAQTSSSGPYPLSGWAWSSTVGWISFNSTDAGAGGGPYGVQVNNNGNFGGYAWSPNIGWVSFNSGDLAVSPSCSADAASGTAGPATVSTTTGAVTGWIRAVAGEGRTDGWDGCIELSGPNHVSPDTTGNSGVTYDTTAGLFRGYAWGGSVVGWLQFSPTLTTGTVVSVFCTSDCGGVPGPSLTFSATNGLNTGATNLTGVNAVQAGSPITLNWGISGLTGCATSGSDWPKVVPSPSTVTANQTGYGVLTYGSGDVGTGKQLGITCNVPNTSPVQHKQQYITIDVIAAEPPTNNPSNGSSTHATGTLQEI